MAAPRDSEGPTADDDAPVAPTDAAPATARAAASDRAPGSPPPRHPKPPGSRRVGRIAAALLVAYCALWHAPGLFGGRTYVAEDTLAYFAANRAVHHALASRGEFSWWDPLPGLGQPRLANIQNGSFSPGSLLFYALPPGQAFRLHPFLAMTAIGLAGYALFRRKGAEPGPALLGALSFATLGNVTTHFQHPPVIETLLFLPLALWCWERFLTTDRTRYVVGLAGAGAAQALGSSPQYLLYGALVMAIWIGDTLWRRRRERAELRFRVGALATAAALALGLASWQLLPFLELAARSHRELLADPAAFRELFRAAPVEVARALAAELHLLAPAPVLRHGAPYRELPNLSLLATGLALSALFTARRARPWAAAGGAAFFLVGMLGAAGGVASVLGLVFPFADRLRAPYRMIVPAGFLLAWLAALGAQHLPLRAARARRAVAWAAAAWVAVLGLGWKRPLDRYADPSVYDVPPAIARAEGRLAVDFAHERRTPLFAVNAGLAAGVPVLLQREVLIPAAFFEGWFASQVGPLGQRSRLDRAIVGAALPLVDARAPLLRSYGLRTVVRWGDAGPRAEPVAEPVPRFRLVRDVRHVPVRERLWAALHAGDWDPRTTVFTSRPVSIPTRPADPAAPARAHLSVELDRPGHQRLRVRSDGGLLVTSGLWFPGWGVRVDGRPAEPVPADLALRAVALPPGEHRVEWRYRPTWLSRAGAASALGAAAAGVFAVGSRRRRHRPGGGAGPASP